MPPKYCRLSANWGGKNKIDLFIDISYLLFCRALNNFESKLEKYKCTLIHAHVKPAKQPHTRFRAHTNMAFGLYSIFISGLLFLNSLAILNDKRVLAKCTALATAVAARGPFPLFRP